MKIRLLLLMLLSSIHVLGQQKKKKDFAFSPDFIVQQQVMGGVNLFIGEFLESQMMIGMTGTRIGVESNFRSGEEFIIAPKIGYEISLVAVVARLTALNYFQNKHAEFRLLPEVGISLGGNINLTYGYNFRLTPRKITDISNHRMCLSFNINRKLYD